MCATAAAWFDGSPWSWTRWGMQKVYQVAYEKVPYPPVSVQQANLSAVLFGTSQYSPACRKAHRVSCFPTLSTITCTCHHTWYGARRLAKCSVVFVQVFAVMGAHLGLMLAYASCSQMLDTIRNTGSSSTKYGDVLRLLQGQCMIGLLHRPVQLMSTVCMCRN